MRTKLTFCCLILGHFLFSQIVTDRPTQSFSPHVMPKSGFQVETGFLSERPNSNADVYNITYLNVLLRYGLSENVELRLTQNYLGEKNGATINGMSPTTLGTKIHIHDQTGSLPQVGLLASITMTNGDDNFSPSKTIQDIRLLFQHDLSENLTLDYNIGTFWEGGNPAVGLYTIMIGMSASDKVGFFLEPYGFFGKNSPTDNRFNAGMTYLASDKLQFDLSGGNGLTTNAPDYFISFGISFLF